jgi:Cytochrome c554 and c-prime
MTPRRARTRPTIATALALVASAAWLGLALGAGSSDEAIPALKDSEKPKTPSAHYMGTAACSLCHDNGSPRFHTNLVHLDEYHIWAADEKENRRTVDAHHLAYKALVSPRAKEIEQGMGRPDGWATTAESGCLNCHAANLRPDNCDRSLNIAAELAQGIGCEACHGPASLWIDKHWKRAEWRDDMQLSAEAKQDRYKVVNVRDPVARTELCLSCHLGNLAEGKFVTHEMFAAGHPPLPPFEIEALVDNMPPHWRPAAEKPAAVQTYLGFRPLARTRAVVLEGLIELRASIRLLADQADGESRPAKTEIHPGISDFALYNCAACHHELVIPSQRQERGYGGFAPGRPALRFWTLPLARLGLEAAKSDDNKTGRTTLEALLSPLEAATSNSPFGPPAAIHSAAQKVVADLDKSIKSLAEKGLDAAGAKRMLQHLCRLGSESPLDYDSARQLAAAIQTIVADLADKSDAKMVAAVESLRQIAAVGSSAEFDPGSFRSKLKEIGAAPQP